MTKNRIRDGLPGQPGRYDLATIGVTALALVAWIVGPFSALAGGLLVVAGVMQAVRLSRWNGWRAARDPLVLILHVGYFWVPTGLLLLGAGLLGAAIPGPVAIHALTAGAMATMILAVMTRATLGHTGRPLVADSPTTAIYLLVTAGAVLRVAAPFGWIDYTLGMEVAALAWGGAFLGFLLRYGPILFGARLDDPAK